MKKDIARKTYLKKRHEQVPATFKEESSKLVHNSIALIEHYKPKCIHCFLPIHSRGEINTTPIIQYCWENNIKVLVPVSNFADGTLKNAQFRPHTKTSQTHYNITEPIDPVWEEGNDIDMVITPLLAFDCKGYRVGYGKGFYDRFFASLPKEVKRVGISLFDPCTEIVDISSHDIPLTHCVTPNKTYFF